MRRTIAVAVSTPKPKRRPGQRETVGAQLGDHRRRRMQVDGDAELLSLREDRPVALLVEERVAEVRVGLPAPEAELADGALQLEDGGVHVLRVQGRVPAESGPGAPRPRRPPRRSTRAPPASRRPERAVRSPAPSGRGPRRPRRRRPSPRSGRRRDRAACRSRRRARRRRPDSRAATCRRTRRASVADEPSFASRASTHPWVMKWFSKSSVLMVVLS